MRSSGAMAALARGAAREEDGNLVYGDGEGDLTLTVARDLCVTSEAYR